MVRIYLDNCCFNRPYDNQEQMTIFLETEAKLYIQNLIKEKKLELVWSYILDFENYANQNEEKRELIQDWLNYSICDIEENIEVIDYSKQLNEIGLDYYDSLHIACAIFAECNYFITTDSRILKRASEIKLIEIANPLDFIKILEDEKNEN